MKKIIMIAVMMLMCACMTAQENTGLFQRGPEANESKALTLRGGPGLPPHGEEGDQPAPIGGVAFPLVFAAGYLALKNRKKESR
jgi:hypothetical protein